MDRAELRAEIARAGISNLALARQLGISDQAFYNKMNGKSEFRESEIRKLVEILSLSPEKLNLIFLRSGVN